MLSSPKAFKKNELEDLIKTFKKKLLFPHEAEENNTGKITEELILTFQKMAEVIEHYQDLFDNALQGIFIATIEGKVIACNPECAKMLGYESNEELIGKKDFIRTYFYDPKEASNLNNKLRKTGELKNTEYLLRRADGSPICVLGNMRLIETENNESLIQGIILDITARKLAEEMLNRSEEKYRKIVETAGEGFYLMNEDLTIVDVNKSFCEVFGFAREDVLGKKIYDLASKEFKEYALANKEALLAKEYRTFEGTAVGKDGRNIPLLIHGNTLRDSQGSIIGHMAFVTDLTEQKKALALAGEVQKSLLPQRTPSIPGLDIAAKSISCEEIGGDYFDFFWQRENLDGPFSVVVGDIAGHGVDAALLMISARTFLRMRSFQPGNMSEIICAMNRHLTQDILETGRFMTLFYMTINLGNDRIDWVRAGHDPAIIYDPTQDEFEQLKGEGVALGVDDEFKFGENHKTEILDGQIIAIGTDGIWEARSKSEKMFGKERFKEIIRQNASASADDILNAVYSELNQFTKGRRSEDDITLVVIKINRFGKK